MARMYCPTCKEVNPITIQGPATGKLYCEGCGTALVNLDEIDHAYETGGC